jgi:hypothetical protein
MTEKRSKGFVELEWVCPNCSGRNPGPQKTCGACGAPQPDNVEFVAAEKKLVDDEEKLAHARAGADIHCGYCGARNRGDAVTCTQCGGDLAEGSQRASGRKMVVDANLGTISCPACGTENKGRGKCVNCGAPLTPAAASASAAPAKPKTNPLIFVAVALVVLIACCVGIYLLFFATSGAVDASVANVGWQTSVTVQEEREVRKNNVPGNPPSNAYDVSCETKTDEVCKEEMIDRGNGFAELVETCETRTDQFCSYKVVEWTTVDTLTLDGNDLNPRYATVTLTAGQQFGPQGLTMTVWLMGDDGQEYQYSPDTLAEFQQFTVGSQWLVSVNMLGGVVGVERK